MYLAFLVLGYNYSTNLYCSQTLTVATVKKKTFATGMTLIHLNQGVIIIVCTAAGH